jgi:hypothetical protein
LGKKKVIPNKLVFRLPPFTVVFSLSLDFLYVRAVKMGYLTHFGPTHSSFGFYQTGLKIPDKIWTVKIVSKPNLVWAFEIAHFIFIF